TPLYLVTISAIPAVLAHCGTTSDATFSDCQAQIDPTNVCHYSNADDLFSAPAVAYNTACYGHCCVYSA
ncbi:hypothetical protein C8J57DRAFT_955408, partial [Mycena rebaudengoi]